MNHKQEPEKMKAARPTPSPSVPNENDHPVLRHIDASGHSKENSNRTDPSIAKDQKASISRRPNASQERNKDISGNSVEEKKSTTLIHSIRSYKPSIEGGRELIQQL